MFCPKCKSLLYPQGNEMVCKRCGFKRKKGISFTVRLKDWWIKGLQLNQCYIPHWNEIKETFDEYGVDLNRQGPIITMQTLKQVRVAKEITEQIKNVQKIREKASESTFPLRSVQSYDGKNREKMIDGNIFLAVMRLVPEFCLEVGYRQLSSFLENGNSAKYFGDVLSTTGTILNTADDIELIVKKMVKTLK